MKLLIPFLIILISTEILQAQCANFDDYGGPSNLGSLSASPAPDANGQWPAGTVVQFCFTAGWEKPASSGADEQWMHGVSPVFGSGWDISTLQPVGSVQNAPNANWIWMNTTFTHPITGAVFQPGWYVDGGLFGGINGDPTDNLGDDFDSVNDGETPRVMCWSIQVSSSNTQSCELGFTIETYGDGEVGSFTSGSCEDDPLYTFPGTPCVDCDATWNAPAVLCETDAPVDLNTLITGDNGGVWSGNGVSGSTFTPSSLTAGTNAITYTLAGCDLTQDIVVNPLQEPTISAINDLCEDASSINLSADISGGTWSGTGVLGSQFDPSVGPGSYNITYTLSGSCTGSDNTTINVISLPDPTITSNGSYCLGDPSFTLTSIEAGGTWSGNGVSESTFSPSSAGVGNHVITYDITNAGGCSAQSTANITVTAGADATITAVTGICEDAGIQTLSAVDNGGVWSGTGMTNNQFDPSVGVGLHEVIYTISGSCGDADTVEIKVYALPDATITSAGSYCLGDPSFTLASIEAGGTWSGNGVSGNTFSPSSAGVGNHVITYDITNAGGCSAQSTANITVTAGADATITAITGICEDAGIQMLSAVDNGGVWSGTGMTNNQFDPSVGAGLHEVIYTISGSCGDADTVEIEVNALPDATITSAGSYCLGDAAFVLSSIETGGTWSGNGVSGTIFSPSMAGEGSHTITYQITNADGCTSQSTTTIDVNSSYDATITPIGFLCEDAGVQNLVAVDNGGVWTGTGMSNNQFDPGVGAGTYPIIYTIAGSCGDADTISITVLPNDNASITSIPALCVGDDPVPLQSASSGGSWTGSGVNSSTQEFDPALASIGSNWVYFQTNGACSSRDSIEVNVIDEVSPSLTSIGSVCDGSGRIDLAATPLGGVWSGNGVTGNQFNADLGPGNYVVTYTPTGSCAISDSMIITVEPADDITISGNNVFCDTDPGEFLTVNNGAGQWSGTGVDNLGFFDPSLATVGVNEIIYATSGQCNDADTISIQVNATPVISITSIDSLCEGSSSVTLNALPAGGLWTGNGVSNDSFDPSLPGSYTVYYALGGSCPNLDSTTVVVNPMDQANITSIGSFCEMDTTLVLEVTGSNGTWMVNGQTSTDSLINPGYGNYTVSYQTSGFCGIEETFDFEVYPVPNAEIMATIDEMGIMDLYAESNDIISSWDWNVMGQTSSFSYAGASPEDHIQVPYENEIYQIDLVVVNDYGCVDTVQTTASFEVPTTIYIPNAFSPDGKNNNNEFQPIISASQIEDYQFSVFNRWGERIFYTNQYGQTWDGGDAQIDVYIYRVQFKDKGKVYDEIGSVTLVR